MIIVGERHLILYSNIPFEIPSIENLSAHISREAPKRISGEEIVAAFAISVAANLTYDVTKVAVKALIAYLHGVIQSRAPDKDADLPKVTLIVSRTRIHLEGAFDQNAILEKVLPLLDDRQDGDKQ